MLNAYFELLVGTTSLHGCRHKSKLKRGRCQQSLFPSTSFSFVYINKPTFMLPSIKELLEFSDVAPTTSNQPGPNAMPRSDLRSKSRELVTKPLICERQYKCGIQSCGAIFKQPELLKRHMLTHNQQRPFRCDINKCGKRFSRRDNYMAHIKKHPAEESVSLQRTNSEMELKLSNDTGSASSSTACSSPTTGPTKMCTPTSPTGSVFGPHSDDGRPLGGVSNTLPPLEMLAYASLVQSNDEFPPSSAATGQSKRYKQALPVSTEGDELTELDGVITTAEGDPTKPFMCTQCGSRFGRLEHVKRHRLVHTGQKKHGCPDCSKAFARKDNMVQHWRAHKKKQSRRASKSGGSVKH